MVATEPVVRFAEQASDGGVGRSVLAIDRELAEEASEGTLIVLTAA